MNGRGPQVDMEPEDVVLMMAIARGDVQAVEAFIEKGGNIDAPVAKSGGVIPIQLAALTGQLAVVQLLISNGANLNVQDTNGFTPLHAAAKAGKIDVVNVLLKNDAVDVNRVTFTGENAPIEFAADNQHKEVVSALLMHPRIALGIQQEKLIREKLRNEFVDNVLLERENLELSRPPQSDTQDDDLNKFRTNINDLHVKDIKKLITHYTADFVNKLDPKKDAKGELVRAEKKWLRQLKAKILSVIKNKLSLYWVEALIENHQDAHVSQPQLSKQRKLDVSNLKKGCALVDLLNRGKHRFDNHETAKKKPTKRLAKLCGILQDMPERMMKYRATRPDNLQRISDQSSMASHRSAAESYQEEGAPPLVKIQQKLEKFETPEKPKKPKQRKQMIPSEDEEVALRVDALSATPEPALSAKPALELTERAHAAVVSKQPYHDILSLDEKKNIFGDDYVTSLIATKVTSDLIELVQRYMQTSDGRETINKVKKNILRVMTCDSSEKWKGLLQFSPILKKEGWRPNFFTKNHEICMKTNSALYYILNQGRKTEKSIQHGKGTRMTKRMKELVDFLLKEKTPAIKNTK